MKKIWGQITACKVCGNSGRNLGFVAGTDVCSDCGVKVKVGSCRMCKAFGIVRREDPVCINRDVCLPRSWALVPKEKRLSLSI